MDKILLKRAAFQSVALMFAVILLSYALRHYHSIIISANDNVFSNIDLSTEPFALNQGMNTVIDYNFPRLTIQLANGTGPEQMIPKKSNTEELKKEADKGISDQLGERYLVIKKPAGTEISYQIEDLYISKSIRFVLTGNNLGEIDQDMVERVHSGEKFYGVPQYKEIVNTSEAGKSTVIARDYGNDFVHAVSVKRQNDKKSNKDSVEMLIELDNVYVQNVYEDDKYYFINLRKPKEVYDKVIVIDAGHGGKDAGALSVQDGVYEKHINLQIVLQLKKLMDQEDIKVYYTRLADDKVFLRPRLELANAVDCDFFISIHNNASTQEWPNGMEILYYDKEYNGVKNKDLASIFSDEISKTTLLEPRGLVEENNDDVFILNHAVVPAVLIEVGYLTNYHDMNYLSKESNREDVALGIYNGIMRAYQELDKTDHKE